MGQAVTLATAPPGVVDDDPKTRKGRREWEAVRRFVRDYCQGSCARSATVTADLRQVIWVFIRNISQAFTQDEEIDSRLRAQMGRLEALVETNATAELKREVLDAVGAFKQILKERSDRQRNQMEFLGRRSVPWATTSNPRAGKAKPIRSRAFPTARHSMTT